MRNDRYPDFAALEAAGQRSQQEADETDIVADLRAGEVRRLRDILELQRRAMLWMVPLSFSAGAGMMYVAWWMFQ